jgi:hypothetical protein
MAPRAIIAVLVLCLAALPAVAQSQKAPATGQKKEQPASSKTPPKPGSAEDPVIARVNGTAIYRSDMEVLRATLPAQVQQQPPQDLYNRLLDQLISLELVS